MNCDGTLRTNTNIISIFLSPLRTYFYWGLIYFALFREQDEAYIKSSWASMMMGLELTSPLMWVTHSHPPLCCGYPSPCFFDQWWTIVSYLNSKVDTPLFATTSTVPLQLYHFPGRKSWPISDKTIVWSLHALFQYAEDQQDHVHQQQHVHRAGERPSAVTVW